MALSISNVFHSPKPKISLQNSIPNSSSISNLSSSSRRFPRRFAFPKNKIVICAASSAAGSSNPESDLNPYEVLGVNPIGGFEKVKQVYTRKHKEADKRGDEVTAALLEKAYDKLMMAQLMNRKKGLSFGTFKVSKDVKYADKQPIVSWGPSFCNC